MKLIRQFGPCPWTLKAEDKYDDIAIVAIRVLIIFVKLWIVLQVLPTICVASLNWIFVNTIHVPVPYNWWTWSASLLFLLWCYYDSAKRKHRLS